MADRNDATARLRQLIDERVTLETRLQNEPGELSTRLRASVKRSISRSNASWRRCSKRPGADQ
jgi:hypothetical protein